MNKCLNCAVETKNKKYCSHKCSNIHKWKDPKYHKKQTLNSRKTHSNPDVNKKISNSMKEHWDGNEDRYNILKNTQKKIWNTKGKKRHSNKMKEIWSDSNYKDKVSKSIKESHSNPLVIQKISEASKRFWSKENREKHSNLMLNYWDDPNFADKQFKSVGRYKEIILPSGKIVKVQGYEGTAVFKLLNDGYNEDDLYIGAINIHKEIGHIMYYWNNKIKKYYPDIYIKSENKIIEVKSPFTFNLNEELIYAKKDACINANLNFSFMIIDQSNDDIHVIEYRY